MGPRNICRLLAVALLALLCLHCSRRPEPLAGDLRPLVRQGDTLALSLKLDEHPRLLHKQFRSTRGMLHQFTLLHMAAMEGQPKVADLLLARGADPNVRSGADGLTPLHVAVARADLQLAQVLLDGGADPGAGDAEETPPLYYALVLGHREAARYLLANGAEHDAYSAAAMGDVEALEEALQHNPQSVFQRMNPFGTPLQWAARFGKLETAKALLQQESDPNARGLAGRTPLHMAAAGGHAATVRLLLSHGAELQAQDEERATALHLAAEEGHSAVAELLLEAGAEVNAQKEMGESALHVAAANGQAGVARVLLDHGAELNARDASGATPLERAPSSNVSLRRLLRAGGGRVERAGWTKLQTAAANGQMRVVVRLLERGAALQPDDPMTRSPLVLAAMYGHRAVAEKLVEAGVDPDAPASNLSPLPLCRLAEEGAVEATRILLELGADPTARCGGGQTPLHVAAAYDQAGMVELLLEFGHPVNLRDRMGRTSLHWAAESETTRIAEILLRAGADVNTVDELGNTPLSHAKEFGTRKVARFLEEHGATWDGQFHWVGSGR